MRLSLRPNARVATALAAAGLTLTATVATAPQAPASAPTLKTAAAWRTNPGVPGLTAVPDSAARAWLAQGRVPGGPWRSMVRDALLDLRRLTAASGGVAAGAAAYWGYTWPRDAAFATAAMLASGHRDDALRTLSFLQRVQRRDGGFQARYLLDGSGVPDDRSPQSDGAGWTLWALGQVASTGGAAGELAALQPLLDRATGFVLGQTGDGRRLPAASPDYWEVPERSLTLGIAAALLAGLRAAPRVYAVLGRPSDAARTALAADRLERLVHREFGPGGYQRYAGGGGADAAVCLLLPPFAGSAPRSVHRAWREYQRTAARPAGGFAPGASWRRDGVSWTPETALVAYTAAHTGDRGTAARLLNWLAAHRTSWGSLPEKVLADGRPAGPAPLGWTAAAVVLTAAALEG
ncbi:MAG TPA: glycoside hydrolase family 15 [Dermatophilaceae bacterium]|nr:glycoside hydrolase family 15 [Dermatophilaceae bacterium]